MSAPDLWPAGRAIVIDDQLALLAALGWFPETAGIVPVTTYAWQQRLLAAFVAPRSTEGQLQRLAAMVAVSAATALEAGGHPKRNRLVIADPRATAIEVARIRVSGANPLAAETIAVARSLDAVVLFNAGNSHGHVADHVQAAGLEVEVWDIKPPPRENR